MGHSLSSSNSPTNRRAAEGQPGPLASGTENGSSSPSSAQASSPFTSSNRAVSNLRRPAAATQGGASGEFQSRRRRLLFLSRESGGRSSHELLSHDVDGDVGRSRPPAEETAAAAIAEAAREKFEPDFILGLKEENVITSVPSLQFLWVLPFRENLPEEFLDENEEVRNHLLYDRLLKNYFSDEQRTIGQGFIFTVNEVMFRVAACFPRSGTVGSSTAIRTVGVPLNRHALRRVHFLRVNSSSDSAGSTEPVESTEDLFRRHVRPFFTQDANRHLMLHESLRIGTLDLKVVAADPPDGLMTSQTVVHLEGDPLIIFSVVEVQPVTDNLPSSLHDCTRENQELLLSRFLHPYFDGRERVVSEGDSVSIGGVEFIVKECHPRSASPGRAGVVGLETHLNVAPIFTSRVLMRQRQVDEDARIASELQARDGVMLFANSLLSWLRNFSEQLPENDVRRVQIRQLVEGLSRQTDSESVAVLLQGAVESRGASDTEIQAQTLTWEFHEPTGAPSSKHERENDDRLTCRICLSEYEPRDLVRCLPCFHRFHSACVTDWLRQNKTCPICKMAIDDDAGQRNQSGDAGDDDAEDPAAEDVDRVSRRNGAAENSQGEGQAEEYLDNSLNSFFTHRSLPMLQLP